MLETIGGGRRNRTPNLSVTPVFKTGCRPFSGALRWRKEPGSNRRDLSVGYWLATRRIAALPSFRDVLSLLDRDDIALSSWFGASRRTPNRHCQGGSLVPRHSARDAGFEFGCRSKIRTCDLVVMSHASYQTALSCIISTGAESKSRLGVPGGRDTSHLPHMVQYSGG